MQDKNDQEVEEPLDLPEATDEGEADTTDWKAEAQKLQQKAIRQREKTKELKAKLAEKAEEKAVKTPEKPSDLTDGQKALFVAYGVKTKVELALAKELMGKLNISNPDDLVEDDYFQSRLTKLRNEIVTKEAVPSSTGRSTPTQGNKLDYWLAKYQTSGNLAEVPKELQRDVLNARLKADEQVRKFG